MTCIHEATFSEKGFRDLSPILVILSHLQTSVLAYNYTQNPQKKRMEGASLRYRLFTTVAVLGKPCTLAGQ
jgi:hypothetical protein